MTTTTLALAEQGLDAMRAQGYADGHADRIAGRYRHPDTHEDGRAYVRGYLDGFTTPPPEQGPVDLTLAMWQRLTVDGPTLYAETYADPDRAGRHDGRYVDDSAASDGAAFKLRDELEVGAAHLEAYCRRTGEAFAVVCGWPRPWPSLAPGRHRA